MQGYLIETCVTLLGVCALAVLVLWSARRLGVGRPSGPIELCGHLPLDARRAIYLVKVGEQVFIVGASEGGFTKLGEIAASEVPIRRHHARQIVRRGARPVPPGEAKDVIAAPHGATLSSVDDLLSRPIVLVVALAIVSLLPFAFMTVTAFVKIATVLQIVRSAIGAQGIPSSAVIMALSAALTLVAMAPVGDEIAARAAPLLSAREPDTVALVRAGVDAVREPLRGFMKANASDAERERFLEVARRARGEGKGLLGPVGADDLTVLLPAFIVTELRRGLRGRVSHLPAVSGHRSGHLEPAARAGHADDESDAGELAVQAVAVRRHGRLGAARAGARDGIPLRTPVHEGRPWTRRPEWARGEGPPRPRGSLQGTMLDFGGLRRIFRAARGRARPLGVPGDVVFWGNSSAGRAPRSQCGGPGFDPPLLHPDFAEKTSALPLRRTSCHGPCPRRRPACRPRRTSAGARVSISAAALISRRITSCS